MGFILMPKKILFIGAPGSGKSFLTNKVFTELKSRHRNAEIVHEWIRYDIQKNGPLQSTWEQYRTRMKQMELEDNVPDTYEFVVVDSGSVTPYFYACLYGDYTNPRQRIVVQDMFKYLLDDIYLKRYDYIFYLPAMHTYAVNKNILKDGTRFQTEDQARVLDEHMRLVFTQLFKTDNIFAVDVPLEERCQFVLDVILKDETQLDLFQTPEGMDEPFEEEPSPEKKPLLKRLFGGLTKMAKSHKLPD